MKGKRYNRCGQTKPIDRFFYNKHYKRYENQCKKCMIRSAAMGRRRKEIRAEKRLNEIKKDINDDKYMEFGIDYLAELITRNLIG